jgi:hypothetical protein
VSCSGDGHSEGGVLLKRLKDFEHVVRAAGLLAGGLILFIIVRQAFIPADFGVFGFYRAGALVDSRSLPIQYGGQPSCVECHDALEGTPKENRHTAIRCEACHGPLARHAADADANKPKALDPRLLCLSCHTKGAGKPAWFPQVVIATHEPNRACGDCHRPHRPKVDPAIKSRAMK